MLDRVAEHDAAVLVGVSNRAVGVCHWVHPVAGGINVYERAKRHRLHRHQ